MKVLFTCIIDLSLASLAVTFREKYISIRDVLFQGPVQFSNGDRLGVIEIQQFQGK